MQNWNTENYYENHPYLTEGAVNYLKDRNVKLVGIDAHNIDNTIGWARPVHAILLNVGILTVEHLCNLHLLPQEHFTFNAVPPKIKGAGTFPARAFAEVKQSLA